MQIHEPGPLNKLNHLNELHYRSISRTPYRAIEHFIQIVQFVQCRTSRAPTFVFSSPAALYSSSVSLKLYLITVDLLEEGDYASLKERLRTLDARQILERQWALRSTYTAMQLKDLFRGFIAERDRIVVGARR